MKKLLLSFLIFGLFTGCSSTSNRDVSKEDSINQENFSDTNNHTEGNVDEPSLDINHSPIKQDTVLQAQEETQISDEEVFINKIPDPLKLLKKKDKYLKSMGYQGNFKKSKNVSQGYNERQKGTFVYSSGSKKCEISLFREYVKERNVIGCEHYEYKVTISGDESALENFYKKAKKLRISDDDWGGVSRKVKKNGNTVILSGGGC